MIDKEYLKYLWDTRDMEDIIMTLGLIVLTFEVLVYSRILQLDELYAYIASIAYFVLTISCLLTKIMKNSYKTYELKKKLDRLNGN